MGARGQLIGASHAADDHTAVSEAWDLVEMAFQQRTVGPMAAVCQQVEPRERRHLRDGCRPRRCPYEVVGKRLVDAVRGVVARVEADGDCELVGVPVRR